MSDPIQSPRSVVIHHFDDEPHNIVSIRNNIETKLLCANPPLIREEDLPPDEGDWGDSHLIRVHLPTGILVIDYRIYESSAKFLEKADFGPDDLVLLDGYEQEPNGALVPPVEKCARKAAQVVPKGRVFLVSAYFTKVPTDLQDIIAGDCLISKPFKVDEVSGRLLDMLGIEGFGVV